MLATHPATHLGDADPALRRAHPVAVASSAPYRPLPLRPVPRRLSAVRRQITSTEVSQPEVSIEIDPTHRQRWKQHVCHRFGSLHRRRCCPALSSVETAPPIVQRTSPPFDVPVQRPSPLCLATSHLHLASIAKSSPHPVVQIPQSYGERSSCRFQTAQTARSRAASAQTPRGAPAPPADALFARAGALPDQTSSPRLSASSLPPPRRE